ncbi:MAG TPA: hypothetical protein DCS76_09010 [Gemmatimonadetes bacterium]|nr:hypothetical protein [Gemmatimonadota bacterium]
MNFCISERSLALSARLPKWRRTWPALFSCTAGLLMAVLAVSPALSQSETSGPTRESWSVGLAAGAFKYEPSGDQRSAMIALRADRPISRWLRLEASTTYTRPEVQTAVERTNLVTVTLGIQGRWTLDRFEPYGGLSAGFFGRYDGGSTGSSITSSTIQFPLGIRIWATDNLGVRGEYRFNFDSHQVVTNNDSELTAGVFWTL